jgi:hypothetical protein
MVESSSQDEYKSALDKVECHYFPRFHNPCHIFDRCKAAIDDGIVKRVLEVKRIVEIVDSEQARLIALPTDENSRALHGIFSRLETMEQGVLLQIFKFFVPRKPGIGEESQ